MGFLRVNRSKSKPGLNPRCDSRQRSSCSLLSYSCSTSYAELDSLSADCRELSLYSAKYRIDLLMLDFSRLCQQNIRNAVRHSPDTSIRTVNANIVGRASASMYAGHDVSHTKVSTDVLTSASLLQTMKQHVDDTHSGKCSLYPCTQCNNTAFGPRLQCVVSHDWKIYSTF